MTTTTCPSCGRQNPSNQDFCECGEYLRWEATAVRPAADQQPTPPTAAPTPPAPAAPSTPAASTPAPHAPLRPHPPAPGPERAPGGRAGVQLTLRPPDSADASSVGAAIPVTPGGRISLRVHIRNQSGIVDNYDIGVSGLPQNWWTVSPRTVYLVPFGSAGGSFEQEVELALHPPRSPDAQARDWPFRVVAQSRASGNEVASAPGTLAVGPYQELGTDLQPQLASGRRHATFTLTVANRSNAAADVVPTARDSENRCRFELDPPRLTLQPGHSAATQLTIVSPDGMWIGRPVDRRFQAGVTVAGGGSPPPTRDATFRQRPLLPWWVPLLMVPLIIALVAILALAPDKTEVPDVRQASSTFEAAKILEQADLKLSSQNDQKESDRPPGSILDQTPDPGEEVDKGSEVKLLIAAGDKRTTVPSIIGLTAEKADDRLRDAELSFAPMPADADANATIESQRPAAGRKVKEGEIVTGRFSAPEDKEPSKDESDTGDKPETGGADDGSSTPPPPPQPPAVKPAKLDPKSFETFTSGQTQTMSLTNPNSEPLDIGAVNIIDAEGPGEATDFTLEEDCGSTPLDPGPGCEVSVTFNPPGDAPLGQERNAVLVFEDVGAATERKVPLHGVVG